MTPSGMAAARLEKEGTRMALEANARDAGKAGSVSKGFPHVLIRVPLG